MSEKEQQRQTGLEIAVIGMAGRFPGANNIDQFWENLVKGQEPLWFISPEELERSGIAPRLYNSPNYVKAIGGILEGKEYFDASFFGYTSREAEIMDPQIRIFHECAWEALENAGWDPHSYVRSIGLFAGASSNFDWKAFSLLTGKSYEIGQFAANLFLENDLLCSRISYSFNLKGPGFFIGTACSTSLVAIHLAGQALLSGECDMALAGGVSLRYQDNKGYMYEEGMIDSPDGHCRAFDAEAKGIIGGEGVGIVVLKRLQDAIHDRDTIGAVIKGSAINNDGNRKVGYTAPSVTGQAEVIRWALEMAEIELGSIGYLETHGTGTTLGDPIEVGALIRAFQTDKKQFCRIGSVKTNVGHLGAAAGVAGFIKTVLILKNKVIPPSLHFNTPNPKIDFQNSPFYVNAALSEWKDHDYPLRAGVSSFGIGGTNAHVILEEFSGGVRGLTTWPDAHPSGKYQLILLSAMTPTALEQMTSNLAEYFKKNPNVNIADAAYTLQVGRKDFKSRRKFVCSSISEATALLCSSGSRKIKTHAFNEKEIQVVFIFAGLGSQYVNMGRGLYESEPVFRQQMNRCFEILNGLLDDNIKEILYPGIGVSKVSEVSGNNNDDTGGLPGTGDSSLERVAPQGRGVSKPATRNSQPATGSNKINQTDIAQVVIFIIEYALAKLLMKWGIRPHAMMGYSFGEYATACISGVFSLEDALKLVVARGKLIRKLPPGVMMSVPLPREELTGLLPGNLSIAVDNGPSCIVSGPCAAVAAFEKQMKAKGFLCMRLRATHAIHSKMMDTILKEFEQEVENIRLKIPEIRYISNVTGAWLTGEEAVTSTYWVNHLRETVKFSDGINQLTKNPNTVFIEIGPGGDLTTLLQRHIQGNPGQKAVNLIKSKQNEKSDIHFLLNKIGELWLYGVNINWLEFHGQEEKHRRRIPLPTYPFKGQSFPTQGDPVKMAINMLAGNRPSAKRPDMADWFYIPSWKRTRLLFQKKRKMPVPLNWLVFMDNLDCGIHLVKQLEMEEQTVITVKAGAAFTKLSSTDYTLNPGKGDEYYRLFSELQKLKMIPDRILHLWSITAGDNNEWEIEVVENVLDYGFFSLFYLARALGKQQLVNEIKIDVITNNMQLVTGVEELKPEKATVLGPVKTIPMEYPNIKCRSLDIVYPPPGRGTAGEFIGQLLDQLVSEADNPISIAALRDNCRWEPVMEPLRLETPNQVSRLLKEEGVYLLVGGTGGIGLELAKYLAKTVRARLALVGRTGFPAREEWEGPTPDRMTRAIRSVQQCEKLAARVLTYRADVTNLEQMQTVCCQVEKKLGPINGIIHCAGLPDGAMIQRRTRESLEEILASKVKGTLILDQIFRGHNLDFLILCSSLGSIVPALGQVGYCAANAFLDSFAAYKLYKNHTNTLTMAINWDSWLKVGMATIPQEKHEQSTGREFLNGMTASEGVEAFNRILGARLPHVQVAVSIKDLNLLTREAAARAPSLTFNPDTFAEFSPTGKTYQRPELDTEYAAPENKTQEILVDIWQTFFGIQPIGIRDNFFELKGDSLSAITVITRIFRELDIMIPIVEFFDRATIEKIAAFIDENSDKIIYSSIEPVEEKEYYVLSSAQKGLYFVQQLNPGNTSYNMPQAVPMQGYVEIERLEEVFKKLIHRHESLRTSFDMVQERPVQKINRGVDFAIEYYETGTRKKTPGNRKIEIEEIMDNFVRSFDLAKAPLLRLGFVKVESSGSVLLLDMHHIITDAISRDILINDITALYGGESLPPLKLRYKDYSQWQASEKNKESLNKQEAFWLKNFEDGIPTIDNLTDYPRNPLPNFESARFSFKIPGELTAEMKKLSSKRKVTLYIILLAVYYILLSKYSDQEDIVVGTGVAERSHVDLHNIVGLFVNILALRNRPAGHKTFLQFLAEVKENNFNAYKNQDFQFDELVKKLKIQRKLNRHPIFDTQFTFHHTYQQPGNLFARDREPDEVTREDHQYKFTKIKTAFDLSLNGFETGETIIMTFYYLLALFKTSTIENMANHYLDILEQVMKNKNINLKDIKVSHLAIEAKSELDYENALDFNF
jgi:acyl transferase domain-containing protein/acyl carrier protein